MAIETCELCKFWRRFTVDLPEGCCRRNPPTGQTWGQFRFPPVDADDWCGEWEAIPPP